ncbi:unnamed protein product [Owenia fusiformis]|uniref:Uncharacterized protein n=1 Tax=Owenia fusiformis TaxID=6347 RepID=A0A8J1XU42_OWEFU|nr:unnamed protein product [Owenia fusiformis]
MNLVLIVFTVHLLSLVLVAAGDGVQRTSKTIKRSIPYVGKEHHEKLIPIQLDKNGRNKRDLSTTMFGQEHAEATTFLLQRKNSDDIILDLKLNRELIPRNIVEVTHSRDHGRREQHVTPEHCYYHGSVRDMAESLVTISTCDGLRGHIAIADQTYHIERDDIASNTHILIPTDIKSTRTCGHTNLTASVEFEGVFPHGPTNNIRKKRNAITQFNTGVATRYVELFLVFDTSAYATYGSLAATRTKALEIANAVDAFYKSLNMRVPLVGVEYWTDSNRATVTSNYDTTIDNFCTYSADSIPRDTTDFDVAHLITGVDLTGSVVGYGTTNTMCSTSRNCGINEDNSILSGVASTVAHELGHNLGMLHDDGGSCSCEWSGGCIMAAVGTSDPQAFTDCSNNALNSNVFTCLSDAPTSLYSDPVCGNAIKEADEECDCGTAQECPTTDPCCEVGTCKLKASSQCGGGECCSNCTYSMQGTLCRAANGECDLNETCSGNSGECPTDVEKIDGTLCYNDTAYCYRGSCMSRDAQCKNIFGPSASNNVAWCYDTLNGWTDAYGNCGVASIDSQGTETYIECATADKMCGKIQCAHPDPGVVLPVIGDTVTGTVVTSGDYNCKGGDVEFADMPNPGLVADGTECGSGMVCKAQKCITLSAAGMAVTCSLVNGIECAGRGTCSQSGRCVCTGNYDAGTHCETEIDPATLLRCYQCSDSGSCATNFTSNVTSVTCESNSMICKVDKLTTTSGSLPQFTRGCAYASECSEACQTAAGVSSLCTKCCSTSLCNTDIMGDVGTIPDPIYNPGGNSGLKEYASFLSIISSLLFAYIFLKE